MNFTYSPQHEPCNCHNCLLQYKPLPHLCILHHLLARCNLKHELACESVYQKYSNPVLRSIFRIKLLFVPYTDVRNYFALTYVSPLDARQRMLVFKLSAEIEKKDWLDQLVSLISESNCCAGSVSFFSCIC